MPCWPRRSPQGSSREGRDRPSAHVNRPSPSTFRLGEAGSLQPTRFALPGIARLPRPYRLPFHAPIYPSTHPPTYPHTLIHPNATTKRIAIISEHASPLGTCGGTDSGGQNVYVAQTARQLAALGYQIDVFTRRDSPQLPETVLWQNGVRVVHVPAGLPHPVPKEQLLPYMDEFTQFMRAFSAHESQSYDLIHANFWMSALVAHQLKQQTGVPFVVTFHALGKVRRQHQGAADKFPDVRFAIEKQVVQSADGIIAECFQDRDDLIRLYAADASKIHIVPCGVDLNDFWPIPQAQARATLGLPLEERIVLQLGRMVPRKGVDTVIQAIALLNQQRQPARLVVGGENPPSRIPAKRQNSVASRR